MTEETTQCILTVWLAVTEDHTMYTNSVASSDRGDHTNTNSVASSDRGDHTMYTNSVASSDRGDHNM